MPIEPRQCSALWIRNRFPDGVISFGFSNDQNSFCD